MDDDTLADLAVVAAGAIAALRIGLGIAATVAPGLVSRLQFGTGGATQTVVVRMLGARDLGLGLGVLLATRHGSAGLRGWVEAGALADGVDAAAFLRAPRGATRRRGLTVLVAGSSAAISAWAARQLSD